MAQQQAPHLPDTTQLARLLAWRGAWISMMNAARHRRRLQPRRPRAADRPQGGIGQSGNAASG